MKHDGGLGLNRFAEAKKIVVKVGTSTLTHSTGRVNIRRVERLVTVLADIANSGRQLVLVTSGALSVGCGKLGLRERPRDTPTRQAASAVGQCELMYLYDELFTRHSHTVAQVLLTMDIVADGQLRQNCTNTLGRLLDMGVIPIINENDTVAVDELEGEQFGDNDNLSAIVATLVEADALIIISDIAGLFTENPRDNPNARLIERVEAVDDNILSIASGSGSNRGTGGMFTKVQAARTATNAGIDTAVVCGEHPDILYQLLEGKPTGTHFVAKGGV